MAESRTRTLGLQLLAKELESQIVLSLSLFSDIGERAHVAWSDSILRSQERSGLQRREHSESVCQTVVSHQWLATKPGVL